MRVRDTILLADGSLTSRSALRELLDEQYNVLEATTGDQALLLLEQNRDCMALILIDLALPGPDGRPALSSLGKLDGVPVIAVVDDRGRSEPHALELGACDVLARPIQPAVAGRRIQNAVGLFRTNRKLAQRVAEQDESIRNSSAMMVDTLSSIIEYRSAESGQHTLRIRRFTEILLEELALCCPEYHLDDHVIQSIASASALHDIGKIAIPDTILNKPGPLTDEEFEIMKTHAAAGSEMLRHLEGVGDREYLRYAYNICRYHHERWDGMGYPDGLAGEDIPICAQVVGLVDAYDALTTPRVYKDAYPCNEAIAMILDGKCGQFSPKLLECFQHRLKELRKTARIYADGHSPKDDAISVPLPPPDTAAPNTLQAVLARYHAVLHYLNACVMEIDLDQNAMRTIYNPFPELSIFHSDDTLDHGLEHLASLTHLAGGRPDAAEAIADRIRQFFRFGLRRFTNQYHLPCSDGVSRWYDCTILRTSDNPHWRKALVLWSPAAGRPQEPDGVTVPRPVAALMLRCRFDSGLTFDQISSLFPGALNFTESELRARCGDSLLALVLPEAREEFLAQLNEQLGAGTVFEVEFPIRDREEERVWFLWKGVLVPDPDGTEHLHGMLMNITRRKKAQEGLRIALSALHLISEQSSDVVFDWDFLTDRFDCPKWEARFGYTPIAEQFSTAVASRSHFHPDDLPDMLEAFRALKEGANLVEVHVRIVDSNGRYSWNQMRATAQRDDDGRPVRAVGIFQDLDATLQISQPFRVDNSRDPLTGLLTKEAARSRIETYLSGVGQTACSGLAIIDLDNFKDANDTYGHMFGDTVLTQVAAEMSKLFRESDVVARFGGDEFLVFMTNLPEPELILRRCETLIQKISALYPQMLSHAPLCCSVGIACGPEHGTTYHQLFQRADRALYQAKAQGKGCCVCYSPSIASPRNQTTANTRIESEGRLSPAENPLVHSVFELLYQSGDVCEAIHATLALVGQHMKVSRVYIFENNLENTHCSNTFEWCAEGVTPEIDSLQNISYETDIPGYEKNFNEQGIFYCPDVTKLSSHLRELLEPQGVKSLLHCAIRENGVFRGYVGFDDCQSTRLWTQDQIDLLTFLSQMVSVFLLKERVRHQTALFSEELRGVLNAQFDWVYVIEPDTFRLRFLNSKTTELAPNAREGMTCHQVLMHRDTPCENCPIRLGRSTSIHNRCFDLQVRASAAPIHWYGEPSWLVTCQEETSD